MSVPSGHWEQEVGVGMKVKRKKERSGHGLPSKCPNTHLWEILLEVPLMS